MDNKKQGNDKNKMFNNATQAYHVPAYSPDHILSPEFEGKSNYEAGIRDLINSSNLKLQKITNKNSSCARQSIVEDIKTLKCLYENYYIGMNVFRNAKGGRDKLRV